VSWAAHEFETYFIQKHVGVKASYLAIAVGTFLPDLVTKHTVYEEGVDAARFHRNWPGVGFTHSLMFGLVLGVLVLAVTRSRSWALGIVIGQWAHVITDISDTAGVMTWFPFTTENMSVGMWKHAAAEGPLGDAVAYYSGLGGIWDFFWFVMVMIFARRTLTADYFHRVIVPADPAAWRWMGRRLWLTDNGLLVVYRAYFLYGVSRMIIWFVYARFQIKAPWQPFWGGPLFVPGNYLVHGDWEAVALRLIGGGIAFCLFVWLCWITFLHRLWDRGEDPPGVRRGTGLHAAFH
jgi:membrane-bound metal-dependent hydrolase YbcI (DUF457 family)